MEAKPPKAARNYMYTIFLNGKDNNHDDEDHVGVDLDSEYKSHQEHVGRMLDLGHLIFLSVQVEECPSTHRPHLQGYVELSRMCTLRQVKSILGSESAHLEKRRGTQEEAIQYCTKESSRICQFAPFIIGEKARQGKRNDWKKAQEMLQNKATINEVCDEIPQLTRYYSALQKYKNGLVLPREKGCEPPEVEVIIGQPGVGKTRYVIDKEKEEDLYIVEEPDNSTTWFDGYEGQEAVLFDDFYGWVKYSKMLRLLDRYPMRVPVKGGFVQWRPKRIYITSNKDIDSWYGSHIPALKRRITKYRVFDDQLSKWGVILTPTKTTIN